MERKRDEIQNQAVNFDLPVQMDTRNQINRGRARWTGFDPTSGSYFPDRIMLGTEVQWQDYSNLCTIESSSGAVNLVQTFPNLVKQGERIGLGQDNWKSLFLMLSEKHLKEAHSAISRFPDNLDGLVNEILQQINIENECCKLRNALMKINRAPN